MEKTISFTLNGTPTRVTTDDERMLLWILREDLGLTGTKYGCGEALCGACTVMVENEAVRSCSTPLKAVAGKRVLTIEGLSQNGRLHHIQEAFLKHHAFQCGYCTPGMIMNAYALLQQTPHPTREQILHQMDGNLCRCGSHVRVVDAIQEAAGATVRRANSAANSDQKGDAR
jgi:aerobic-type carbon monoxide dehydrogenase small subunit (CoxS/CutS family)